ncbi:POK18 protein, partial [Nothocercus nigrocapillus]|nr:POK18 protein [Nothocercus nigrocapillus]
WKYLGWKITDSQIQPQKVVINTDLRTLTHVQTLCGDIQWLRGLVGITNEDMAPLLSLLRGCEADKR